MSFDSRRTPYYLVDLEKITEKYESFSDAILSVGRNDIIAYSVKANYNPAIISHLNKLGSYFEVCSEYEYNLVLDLGIMPSRIIVNGCFLNDLSLYHNSLIILDTYSQLLRWVECGSKQPIGLRINFDFFTVDNRFKNKKSRFGIKIQTLEVQDVLRRANLNNIICLHCHLSGNNREPSIYRDIVFQLQNICDLYQLDNVTYLDIGGGYKIDDRDSHWTFYDYVNAVNEACRHKFQIIFEPGNAIVRNCAEYHTKIIAVKTQGDDSICIVDGSSLHLPKANFNKTGFQIIHSGLKKEHSYVSKIYGNTCKESDLLLEFNQNTIIMLNDHLIIKNIGAYSLNEVNPLILGAPNVYLKNRQQFIAGKYIFTYLCEYKKCYKIGHNRGFTVNNQVIKNGIFALINQNDQIIYINIAYNLKCYMEIMLHFKSYIRNLRHKLSHIDIIEIKSCRLYICPINTTRQDLLFDASFLIGLYKPRFNFL